MREALRRVERSYPMLGTKIEASGEHILLGTGELYLDCVMRDLRTTYGEVEVKISDPLVKFAETVVETSSIKCFAQSANQRNRLVMLAEPLERSVADDIESTVVKFDSSHNATTSSIGQYDAGVAEFFHTKYQWDILASRSVWAFGPESNGANILLNDTIPTQVDRQRLASTKESIIQGSEFFFWCDFCWAKSHCCAASNGRLAKVHCARNRCVMSSSV